MLGVVAETVSSPETFC